MRDKYSSRRDFLQDLSRALLLNHIDTKVGTSIVMNLIAISVVAKNKSLRSDKKHVSIFFAGAPPRWTFDLFLDPKGSSKFDPSLNPMISTCFIQNDSKYSKPIYRDFYSEQHGVRLPWLWQFPVAARGGGQRPLTDLLKNLISIQGIDTQSGSHSGSIRSHFLYPNSTQSLSAFAVDSSSQFRLFNGITAVDGGIAFKSKKYPEITRVFGGLNEQQNLIQSLSEPFSKIFKKDGLSSSRENINRIIHELERSARNGVLKNELLLDFKRDIREKLEPIFSGDLSTVWLNKFNKYSELISRTIDWKSNLGRIDGISDRPIDDNTRGLKYLLGGVQVKNSDLRTLIDPKTTFPQFMAGHFAFAEFVFENNLSQMISISPGPFANLMTEMGTSRGIDSYRFDEHSTGTVPSLYINSMYHRAAGACLLEFIEFLKELGEFENTVIDFSSEFNRAPRLDQSGSDHGWRGKSVGIYSGITQNGPHILGNISKNSMSASPGPWGEGTSCHLINGQKLKSLDNRHFHSTMAHLLGTKTPFADTPSLVTIDKETMGTVTPLIETTKLI